MLFFFSFPKGLPAFVAFMGHLQIFKEVKSPAAVAADITTSLSDQHILACGLNQGSSLRLFPSLCILEVKEFMSRNS